MATTWHEAHLSEYTLGQRVADWVAKVLGSWAFIIGQTLLVTGWIGANLMAWLRHWDPYPFILLNLLFSVQAAYAGPVIMMSQNRQAERDRYQAQADYDTNVRAEAGIEEILRRLERIEKRRISRLAGAADVEPSDLEGA